MRFSFAVRTVAGALAIAAHVLAQAAPAADPGLVPEAMREGKVLWYTTLLPEASRPVAEAFQRRYPGIEVSAVRASAPENARKVIEEARAGKPVADLFDGSSTAGLLMRHQLVQPYVAQSSRDIPEQFKDRDGHWTATVLYFMTLGYNADLVSAAEAPRRWEDLLNPKWRGKMAWSVELAPTAAPGMIATILRTMGEAEGMQFLEQLARQEIANLSTNPRRIVDQVGEKKYPIGLHVMVHHTVMAKEHGHTVDWARIEPLTVTSNAIGIVRNAPHPNAAKLFVDFILSEEGQQLLKQANHIPSNRKVATGFPELETLKGNFISPVMAEEGHEKWSTILKDLFMRKSAN